MELPAIHQCLRKTETRQKTFDSLQIMGDIKKERFLHFICEAHLGVSKAVSPGVIELERVRLRQSVRMCRMRFP